MFGSNQPRGQSVPAGVEAGGSYQYKQMEIKPNQDITLPPGSIILRFSYMGNVSGPYPGRLYWLEPTSDDASHLKAKPAGDSGGES